MQNGVYLFFLVGEGCITGRSFYVLGWHAMRLFAMQWSEGKGIPIFCTVLVLYSPLETYD